jgi:hypothetical protein
LLLLALSFCFTMVISMERCVRFAPILVNVGCELLIIQPSTSVLFWLAN